VLCFAAGFVGWLIPVVTGLPFYAVGLALLAAASPRARRWINRLERRLPEKLRWRLRRTLRRVGGERIRRLVQFPEEMEEPGAKPRSAGPPDPGAPASGR
jgi:hypothetical protein